MRIIILFLSILIILNSCKWFTEADRPYLEFSNFKVPNGTPAFQKGYKDGCSSSLYSRGNVWYRTRYSHKYDPKMISNSEYRFGYQRGYAWCFQYILSGSGINSWDRYLLPFGNDENMLAKNYNDAWGGFFGGGFFMKSTTTPESGIDETLKVFSGGSDAGAITANPFWAGGSKGQFFGQ
jgi:hypothetical protein